MRIGNSCDTALDNAVHGLISTGNTGRRLTMLEIPQFWRGVHGKAEG